VLLRKVAAAEAPARCQAAAESAMGAAAFSIAATTQGVPKYCFLFATRPANLCSPADKKRKYACKYKSLGSYTLEP
jgi:hypothetical protein